MKKIKIMLALIAIIAVTGGALAFKAQKFNVKICVNTTTSPLTSCSAGFKIDPNSSEPSLYWTFEKPDGSPITKCTECTNGLSTFVSSRIVAE